MRFRTTLLQDLMQRAITSENYTGVCLETSFRENFGKVLVEKNNFFPIGHPCLKAALTNGIVVTLKKQILISTVPKAIAFEQALHSGESREVTRSLARLKQLALFAILLPELARRLRKLVPML